MFRQSILSGLNFYIVFLRWLECDSDELEFYKSVLLFVRLLLVDYRLGAVSFTRGYCL